MAKYSEELLNKICDLIKKGLSNKDAAICMGISESTFYQWQIEKPEFSESLKKAEMERKLFLITKIFDASNKSWQAAAWYLERTYPDEFGKQEKKIEIEEPKRFDELYPRLNEENRKIASHLIQKLREEMKVIKSNINQY
ncbi:MAG: helix-turn-helix domain containing protein [Tissierellia bacterium]|nr:helix-turn-helix domain containing protein [Tissierellia bacterium]